MQHRAVVQHERLPAHRVAHLRGHRLHLRAIRIAGEDQELLAAPAHDHVRIAAGPAQQFAELVQHRVAGRMSMGIVDGLEVVDIDQQHAQIGVATHHVLLHAQNV